MSPWTVATITFCAINWSRDSACLHLVEVARLHHLEDLVAELHLLHVGDRDRIGLARLAGDDGPVMRVLDVDRPRLHLGPFLDADLVGAHRHLPPLAVEAVDRGSSGLTSSS